VNAIRWLLFTVGLLIVVGTSISVIKTLVVPRRAWSFLPRLVDAAVTWIFMVVGRRMRSYDLLDRWLGFLGPMVLILTLVAWLTLLVVGFALMLAPWTANLPQGVGESGAATFTLGISSTAAGFGTGISVAAGAAGLIVIALTIAYLPALYSVIRRRETLAWQLGARIGSPAWGPNVLLEYQRTDALAALPALYEDWDRWTSEVADGHTKYPVLNQFRAPRSRHHWLVSLLAVLDAAGLELSLRGSSDDVTARFLLRSGTACSSDLAASIAMTEDPVSIDPITHSDFVAAVDLLSDAGYPVQRSSDEAWATFQDWRAHYGTTICALLDTIVAPPAPWSGSRSLPTRRRSVAERSDRPDSP
jgi:hypothetical protein